MNIIVGDPPKTSKNALVALDLEIFEANKKILHRPTTGRFACLSICSEDDPNTVYLVTQETSVPHALDRAKNGIWTMHNAKFDLTHLRRWANIPPRKKVWCTMIMERIMWGGYFDNFGLDHLVRRYLDVKLDKSLQSAFETATELTEELREYAALDAYYTLPVAKAQIKQMRKEDLRIWQEVDRPAMWATMDFKGFRLDVDAWIALAERNKQRQEEIDASLPVNPRSYKQVKDYLKKTGFKKLPSTGATILEAHIKKFPETEAAGLARKILESRMYSKRSSTYGYNFIRDYIEDDLVHNVKVIHGNYWITGAETGRMSSSDPNMQNIPAKDTKEFRECFIARPDNLLVITDYAQQEARILGYLSQDENLLEILNQIDKDIFVEMTRLIYDKEVEKSDPLRDRVKNLTYGLIYGLSPYGLADRTGMDIDEAEHTIDLFFKKFQGIATFVHKEQKKKDYVQTVLGRRIHLNRYSDQCERNAVNGQIQGTAGDMFKQSFGTLHQEWKWDYEYCVVNVVHDEIVSDTPKKIAEQVGKFTEEVMTYVGERMCAGVPFPSEAHYGLSWASK